MPVVVSLLNSYSGLAAAAAGFVIGNYLLIIAGAMVGAAGLILTRIMCVAMNRSLPNVVLGGFGGEVAEQAGGGGEYQNVRSAGAEEAAMVIEAASTVMVVPGYGLAVAQAQHAVRELADLLEARGIKVNYAIHPVAGRMPGHMNVLLAEAGVPYDIIYDQDEINSEFATADVALIIGANDVVNPVARTDPSSPIFGMPILNADQAKNVIVVKRGQGAGFSGIENALFFLDQTRMLYGDGQEVAASLIHEIKSL
jgi:NAD(P) transhydrogenase subunit beta